jgi:hypothetical protein
MEAKQAQLTPAADAAASASAALETAKTELRLLRSRVEAATKEAEALQAQVRGRAALQMSCQVHNALLLACRWLS